MFARTTFFLSLAFFSYVTASTQTFTKRATCTPISAGDASVDDVPAIAAAIASCGNGGTIVIPAGEEFMIRSTLELTGCVACTIEIEGTLKLSDDTDFWNGVRAVILLNGISGATITTTTGTGLVDGNGQPYWDAFAADSSYARPTLVYIEGSSSDITISKLRFKNAPNSFHSVTGGSKNVLYDTLTLTAAQADSSGAVPKNTDGFDIGESTFVSVISTSVSNQDDCVAFKPGANFVTVTDITCSGSHGISVGSLAEGAGSTDTVSNIIVDRATMINSTKAVGIKLYPGGSSHGIATVNNVTFNSVTVDNSDYAAQIQSCYNSEEADCEANPSQSAITDVHFTNFQGTTSTSEDPVIANLDCPAAGTCDIFFENFDVKAPSGSADMLCSNVDNSDSGLSCSGAASG